MTTDSAPNHGPLAGYRVIELGSTVAGPFCGRLFADFGAEVIKIEPADGDPGRSMADIFKDPHYAARGMLAKVPDDEFGTVTMPNVVPKLSATPGAIRHSGHRVGEDTRRVLTGLAELSAKEIAHLEAQHVIACDQSGDAARSVEASEAS